ncbi:SDR family NAD(P)-dependent oxidoreductase [Conexibacter sp. JD483]|uniref:SDR family oxidoreductase n=1 Tax=unclassified Conexibacter TaxID=2627773 RepID=UPI0027237755|nr:MULTISPECIES: SDR family NAD(P)-dependent oxidoreductase [unclassified Conexibacter]MDO8184004.1 SDR family NAD(P)-dependent oxidoreductase [Conexibacter sp. CPCC 205706]MDO8196996.1 SDR family NAD(P)-dependent oxidoreductase [Conexibacter sp. CPCC 205762]MDR9367912.1 SDR family NAD(P)-dependent oxidoreductase [Conexibacter sp. JD483]
MEVGAGTRALVTGASSGIGEALARALAARGATVGLAARSAGELERLARELPGSGHLPLPCDVASREAIEAAVAQFVAEAGGLELVVANAGVAHYGPFRALTPELVERMTAVNWLGTVWTVRAALEPMVAAGRGHVVIVSSGAAMRSFPDAAVYGATKAAQRAFGEALRHELAGTGVGLTLVYPGEIATHLHDHEKATMPPWYHGGDRAASPDRLADAVLAAVAADRRAVAYPKLVGLLGIVHGLSPALADMVLRRLRGSAAAPRR